MVKGGRYDLYLLIVYCDAPKFLDFEIHNKLRNERIGRTKLIDHTYFLESYNPWQKLFLYWIAIGVETSIKFRDSEIVSLRK